EIAPAKTVVEAVARRRGAQGLLEGVERFCEAAEVVEGPAELRPRGGKLLSLSHEDRPSSEGLLEGDDGRLVLRELELGGAEPHQRVDVVGIPVEGGLERLAGQMIPSQAEAAPAEPVVQSFPSRLTPERGLEGDRGGAVLAEEVL